LSETCKYLYLLFDVDNPINRLSEKYLFTTEGHVFPVADQFRRKIWQDELGFGQPGDDFFVHNVSSSDSAGGVPSDCPNLLVSIL
jgi:hypothetical protein